MERTNWIDARVNKPNVDFEGLSDPVFCLTSNGMILVAEWDSDRGYWYDPETEEVFGDVLYFARFTVPRGWKFNECYYRRDDK